MRVRANGGRLYSYAFGLAWLVAIFAAGSITASAQLSLWSPFDGDITRVHTDRAVARRSFPDEFKLFELDSSALRERLHSITSNARGGSSTTITLPNADGRLEQYEVFEASNFDPKLQAQFPEIRAFSGRGLTDRFASLKMSLSPAGIQTTVFRAASAFEDDSGRTEFIEPYSADHEVYAVFRSDRKRGELPWACSTAERSLFSNWKSKIEASYEKNLSTEGTIRVLRLAQSCNGEYANFFGATGPGQVSNVLAAFNATLTRANGVYEKDLAVHLNLIPETTGIIFYNPATDPYSTTLADWNAQLAGAIANAGITPAMYDIGHMFGASGGGGNAGCIGCVCSTDHSKGMGITSPADGIPMGDNFDIDYVVHEVGHQLGGNHTFTYGQYPIPEMAGQDKEVGSGITIMGYAGVGLQSNVAVHSIDSYHATSIDQIQGNLASFNPNTHDGPRDVGSPCPAGVPPVNANRKPVVAPVANYSIPILTPFKLTGSAADPDGDTVTYNWEQNDSQMNLGATLAASTASPTKEVGPNFISSRTTSSPSKIFPRLSTILAGQFITHPPEADPNMDSEALSAIARDLHFRLTVRDNRPYVPGSLIGQTNYTDMTVSVINTGAAFAIAVPNTAVTWTGGAAQTVVWNPSGTTLPPINTANVNIRMSLDGGTSFPILLKSNTPNDGNESITVPNLATTNGRILVESVGNIFFDINDANITITAPTAANAPIAGRVTGRDGQGIGGATISLTADDGTVITTQTNGFGYYSFGDVATGRSYVIRPRHKRFTFAPESSVYDHSDEITNLNFSAEPN